MAGAFVAYVAMLSAYKLPDGHLTRWDEWLERPLKFIDRALVRARVEEDVEAGLTSVLLVVAESAAVLFVPRLERSEGALLWKQSSLGSVKCFTACSVGHSLSAALRRLVR